MRKPWSAVGMDDAARRKFGHRVRQTSQVWWGWLRDWSSPDHGSVALPGDGAVEYRERMARGIRLTAKRYRISHNYHLTWSELHKLVRHAEANGLEISIHGSSWHSATCFAVVMTAHQEE